MSYQKKEDHYQYLISRNMLISTHMFMLNQRKTRCPLTYIHMLLLTMRKMASRDHVVLIGLVKTSLMKPGLCHMTKYVNHMNINWYLLLVNNYGLSI
ncbi:hypothetical protein M8J75_013212 [Diaphorina citri]|nr:hypothetical protein M8J75_013212 [Diaphorina citri]